MSYKSGSSAQLPWFLLTQFYPTCRNTSRVERAVCFITEVLGDGRWHNSRANPKVSEHIWLPKEEADSKRNWSVHKIDKLDKYFSIHSQTLHKLLKPSQLKTHFKAFSPTAQLVATISIPEIEITHQPVSTELKGWVLILINDWNVWQAIHINPVEDIYFPITIM